MNKKKWLTFLFLSLNFLVTGMVIDRPVVLQNDIFFVMAVLAAAYGLTTYVFYVSKMMDTSKGGDKE